MNPNDWPLKQSECRSNYLHSITYNWLDREGNLGHWVAWSGEVEMKKKETKWLDEAFSAESSNLEKALQF